MRIYKDDIDTAVLRKLQLTQVEILDEIVSICEKHSLRYYLIYGTLLGAARHQGFIPWDDDLDIGMPREDYDKFTKLCKTELSDKFYLHSIENDNGYWLSFNKVRKNGTAFAESDLENKETHNGIFVDIFPLDEARKGSGKWYDIKRNFIRFLRYPIRQKANIAYNKFSLRSIIAFVFKPFSIAAMQKFIDKLMKSENGKGGKYYVNYCGEYKIQKELILKEHYGNGVKILFEGKEYNVPTDYDFVLRHIYKDYMQLPPPEDRIQKHKPEYIDFGD